MNDRLNIVLVHGEWADGSSWSSVVEQLQAEGYHVTAPQFPLTSLANDVARLRQVMDFQDGERPSQPMAAEPPSDSRQSGRTRT